MEKKNKGGRPLKNNAEKVSDRLYLRMSEAEKKQLKHLMAESEYKNATKFVKDKVFKSSGTHSIKNDKNIKNIYLSLSKFVQEYHAVGVNFNQLVRKVNSLSETSGIRYDLKYELNSTVSMFEKLADKQEEILKLTDQFYQEWSAK